MNSLFILNALGEIVIEKHFTVYLTPRDEILGIVEIIKRKQVRSNERVSTDYKAYAPNDYLGNMNLYSDMMKSANFSSIPSVFYTGKNCCIFTVQKDDILLVATCNYEVTPLLVLELLERVHLIFRNYFGKNLNEDVLKSNFSMVYLLLNEMVIGGIPATIDPNIIEMLVPMPSMINRACKVLADSSRLISDLASFVNPSVCKMGSKGLLSRKVGITNANVGTIVDRDRAGEDMGSGSGAGIGAGISGCGSHIWWRKGNTHYSSNEVYVEIIEKLNCIVDSQGNILNSSVDGRIVLNSKLSGVPELNLTLKNPKILSSAAFHPSVRLQKLNRDKVISFCPPDGECTIASYWLNDIHLVPPLKIKADINFPINSNSATIGIQLAGNICNSGLSESFGISSQPPLEDLSIYITLPSSVLSAVVSPTFGSVRFQNSDKLLIWKLDKINNAPNVVYRAEGILSFETVTSSQQDYLLPNEIKCTCQPSFVMKGYAISGIKVDTLDVISVNYSPYKGCRYSTVSGAMEFRL